MRANFVIPGEPVGKGRPQFSTNGGHPHARTPKKTVVYENLVKMEYERQCEGVRFPDDAALSVTITAWFSIPASKSLKVKEMMLAGVMRPTKRPDLDNVMKSILDGLNGVAYRDDVQVVTAFVEKRYSSRPRVYVEIEEITR